MALLHLLVLGCMLGLTFGQPNDPACKDLPNGTGFLAHPDKSECRKYISCYKFFRGEAECPTGMYHKKCPDYDECLTETEINELDPTCKCQFCNGNETSFHPKENSEYCDEFIMCAKGVEILLTCPEGQSYDKEKKTCLNAALVDCDIKTCAKTWDATQQKHKVARAPELKNCNAYSVCVEGEKVISQSCGEGFMYDVNQEEEFNGVTIMGKCIPKPKETISLYADPCPCCEDDADDAVCGAACTDQCGAACTDQCLECEGCGEAAPNLNTCLSKCPACSECANDPQEDGKCQVGCPACSKCGTAESNDDTCKPGCPNKPKCTGCAGAEKDVENCQETCTQCLGCGTTTLPSETCKPACENYVEPSTPKDCPCCAKDVSDPAGCSCTEECEQCSGCVAGNAVESDTCLAKCPQLVPPANTECSCCDVVGNDKTCCIKTCDVCLGCDNTPIDEPTCKPNCPNKPAPTVPTDIPTVPTQTPKPSTPQCFTGRNWTPPTIP